MTNTITKNTIDLDALDPSVAKTVRNALAREGRRQRKELAHYRYLVEEAYEMGFDNDEINRREENAIRLGEEHRDFMNLVHRVQATAARNTREETS